MSDNQPFAVENPARHDEITKIEPARLKDIFAWRELWNYRELLYFLTWRDVKVRYKQTAIGVLWAVLQPVLTTAIFTVIFSRFATFESLQIPYPLFALSGLLVWLFVNNSISLASGSLIGNANMVTKIYFPRLIVPTAATFSGLIDLALGFVILAGVMIYYAVNLTAQILLAPVFAALGILLTIGFGTFFSALNVRFRDVKFALPFFLQVWMFVSPVFYPSESLPEKWRVIFALNPLTGILQGLRASLFGGDYDWFAIGVSAILTFLLVIVSFLIFKRMEDDFADLI